MHSENEELFTKYYERLEPAQKKNEVYLRFRNECLYQHEDYAALHKFYNENRASVQPEVLFGALYSAESAEERAELAEKALALPAFDTGFWTVWLKEIREKHPEEFRSLYDRILNDHASKALKDSESAYEFVSLDPSYSGEVTPELVRRAAEQADSPAVSLVLLGKCEGADENLKNEVKEQVIRNLNRRIDSMNYHSANETAQYALQCFPDDPELKSVCEQSLKALDIYNMLPGGEGNYARGKRILMLGGDAEKAFAAFEEEISNSEDTAQAASCGLELLKGLAERERWQEVIEWGGKLIRDRGILEYDAIALEMNNAFEKLGENSGKAAFLQELAEKAENAVAEENYGKGMSFIRMIARFDDSHPAVEKYRPLLSRIGEENVDMDASSPLGKANVIRYIKKDEDGYIAHLRSVMNDPSVSNEVRSSAAELLIEAVIADDKVKENLDAVDAIGSGRISLSEHLVELLYSIVISYKNIDDGIAYFTRLYDSVKDREDALNQAREKSFDDTVTDAAFEEVQGRGLTILGKLEKMYESALRNGVEFNAESAVEQMKENVRRKNSSMHARIICIWVLAYTGRLDEAAEMLSLLPAEEITSDDQRSSVTEIVERYFGGTMPQLADVFGGLTKDLQLPQFAEHCRDYKDLVMLSGEEKNRQAEYLKGRNIDMNDPVCRTMVMKQIYRNPTAFKPWNLLGMTIQNFTDDPELLYAVANNRWILNTNPEYDRRSRCDGLMRSSAAVRTKYSPYLLYSRLYKVFLQPNYENGSKKTLRDLFKKSKDRSFLGNDPKRRTEIAKDYVHLLKTVDDRDDYLYIKTAMFLATNNGCEEYFYDLFRNDLIGKESGIGIKMCIELIEKHLAGKADRKELYERILNDIHDNCPEHRNVTSVLLSEPEHLDTLCLLLKDYPEQPEAGHVQAVLNRFHSEPDTCVSLLENLDGCYSYAPAVKEELLNWYRSAGSTDYSRMYQSVIGVLNNTVFEDQLYDMCRLADLIAVAQRKTNLLDDISGIYEEQSVEHVYGEDLDTFRNVCRDLIDEPVSENMAVVKAMISGRWAEVFERRGTAFVPDVPHIRELMDYGGADFVREAFSYFSLLQTEKKDQLTKFQREFETCVTTIFGRSFFEPLISYQLMSSERQNLFCRLLDLRTQKKLYSEIPDDTSFIKPLMTVLTTIRSEAQMTSLLREIPGHSAGEHQLIKAAVRHYGSTELLALLAEKLADKKAYSEVIGLKEEFAGMETNSRFDACRAVSLLLTDSEDAKTVMEQADEETFVNIILLLSRNLLNEEIRRLEEMVPERKPLIRMVRDLISEDSSADITDIAERFSPEETRALLKLAYSRSDDGDLRSRMIEKFGDPIRENSYFDVQRTGRHSGRRFIQFRDTPVNAPEIPDNPDLSDCTFLQEALRENPIEPVSDPALRKQEREKAKREYNALPKKDFGVNPRYRMAVLSRILQLSDPEDTASYARNAIRLGIAVYYANKENNTSKAREAIYESAGLLGLIQDNQNWGVNSALRETVCDMLETFANAEEIAKESGELSSAMTKLLAVNRDIEFTHLFQEIGKLSDSIAKAHADKRLNSSIERYETNYKALKALVRETDSQQMIQPIYRAWYRIVGSELEFLKSGTVINLTLETVKCGTHKGRICGIVTNRGTKPAENIRIRALFDESVRCRENEMTIPRLFGKDTAVFAFPVSCREEGRKTYQLELSYDHEADGELVTETVPIPSQEVSFVNNSGFPGIRQNLYSTLPVATDAEFYGREKEKNDIINFLNDTGNNDSLTLHGLKRVGKTSMLGYIERYMQDSELYIPVYRSAQGVGETTAVRDLFIRPVIEKLESIGLASDKVRSFMQYNFNTEPEHVLDFYEYLEKENVLGGKRILQMVDEIEDLFSFVDRGIVNKRLYKVIRVIVQQVRSVRFVFCGADQLTAILHDHSLADIFETTYRYPIARLDQDSMRRMIVDPAKNNMIYTNEALERIWYYTRGHTYYSKRICQMIIEILNNESRTTAYAYDVDVAVRNVLKNQEYFVYLQRFFTENDRKVIRLICANTRCANDFVPVSVLKEQYDGDDLDDTLIALEFKDILEITRETAFIEKSCRFSIELFRMWYSKDE